MKKEEEKKEEENDRKIWRSISRLHAKGWRGISKNVISGNYSLNSAEAAYARKTHSRTGIY